MFDSLFTKVMGLGKYQMCGDKHISIQQYAAILVDNTLICLRVKTWLICFVLFIYLLLLFMPCARVIYTTRLDVS